MKRYLLIATLLIAFTGASFGQLAYKWEGGLFLGASNYMGDVDQPFIPTLKETNFGYGIFLRNNISPTVAARLNLMRGNISGTDENFDDRKGVGREFSSPLTEASLVFEFDLFGKRRYNGNTFTKIFSPYVFAGLGGGFVDPETKHGRLATPAQINEDLKNESSSVFTVPFGLGLKLDASEAVTLGLELGWRPTFTDNLDGISQTGNPDKNDWYTFGGLTLSYRFGGVKDMDKDGIADDVDTCPEVAGLASMNGCPDSDGDGITDAKDSCPTEAGVRALAGCPDRDKDGIADKEDKCPDVAGLADRQGCPIPDRDKDGIEDSKDKCPDDAGIAANNGCPPVVKKDTDKDGITDDLDRCPNTPGIALFEGCPDTDKDGIQDSQDKCPDRAGSVANGGCPEVAQEVKERLAFATKNVFFETGKSILLSKSKPILDEIVTIMSQYPDYSIRIGGYTDNVGNDFANQQLSEARATECKNYLISKGVDPARMVPAGYGETNPIADNSSAAGRAQNRRVEFELFIP